MLIVVIALYVLSWALPVLGLSLLLLGAKRAAREANTEAPAIDSTPRIVYGSGEGQQRSTTIGALAAAATANRLAPTLAARAVVRDFALIGGGVTAGAVASIMSLFLP